MNTTIYSEEQKVDIKEIKIEEVEVIDFKPEDLHHSIDIKEETWTNEPKLDQDEKTLTCEQFKCRVCNLLCTDELQLIEHANIHTEAKQFTVMASTTCTFLLACNLCDCGAYEMASLECHLEIHSDGTLPYCEVKERSNRNFFETRSGHHTSFQCKTCGFKCSARADMEGHKKTHIMKRYACNVCDYKCSNKTQWQRHLRTHTGEKPYMCHFCAIKFIDATALNCHVRTHTGDKLFKCHICNCKFPLKSRLERHLLIHSGVKPFECKFCEYKSSEKQALVKHVRIHTGEKPYECTICDYKCSVNSSLKHHMQTHIRTGKKRSKDNV